MTMATQFATTKVAYTFGIVHPSNADIRFVASDNSSDDNKPVLRVTTNGTSTSNAVISLGDWMPNSIKNYTAAFAIVNEEQFIVNITFVNISGINASYIDIWLHTNRTTQAALETAPNRVKVVAAGVALHTASNCAWRLAAGDGNVSFMNGTTAASRIKTGWDPKDTGHVRYNGTTNIYAKNLTRDWVWVQISLNLPSTAKLTAAATGQIWFHFEASTH